MNLINLLVKKLRWPNPEFHAMNLEQTHVQFRWGHRRFSVREEGLRDKIYFVREFVPLFETPAITSASEWISGILNDKKRNDEE